MRRTVTLLAIFAFSACGGSAQVTPSRPTVTLRLSKGGPPPKHTRYEYIINVYYTYASIFDYPKSTEQVGTIKGVGGQGCTNVLYGYGKKTFWIIGGQKQITEYTVPQTPVKTLSSPAGSNPSSCAMDSSGDLAVGIMGGTDAGDVVIFKNASGSGTAIATPLIREYFDGYDSKGNLFFDGDTRASAPQLDELPNGSSTARTIVTSNTLKFPGSVQWDGKYVAVTDQVADAIYRYAIRGKKAILKGTVPLTGSGNCAQTWIATGVVYCADAGNNVGEVFKYPAGGFPIAVFSGDFDLPLGTVAVEE